MTPYRQRTVVIRTTVETARILALVGRLIPVRGRPSASAGALVGGTVEGRTFTLTFDDGNGQRFQAIGAVRDGPSDRLVRLTFQPDSRHTLWQAAFGLVFLMFCAVAGMSWPVILAGAAFSTTWTAVTLRRRLVPGYFVEKVTKQLVTDLDGLIVHPDDRGQQQSGGSRAKALEDVTAPLNLSPSGENNGTIMYLFRYFYLWCWPVPLVLIGTSQRSEKLMFGGFFLVGLSLVLLVRSTLDAFATTTIIHRRCGLFGLATEEISISAIDEIVVDALPVLPRMGTLIVYCGSRRLVFEGVLDPERAAARLLALRDGVRMPEHGRRGPR